MNTKTKGDISEAFVTAKCLLQGWSVAKPIGEVSEAHASFSRGGFGGEGVGTGG